MVTAIIDPGFVIIITTVILGQSSLVIVIVIMAIHFIFILMIINFNFFNFQKAYFSLLP